MFPHAVWRAWPRCKAFVSGRRACYMIVRMRATQYWPLGPALALCGAALFAGGALRTGPLTWFGAGALVAILALLALRGAPRGVLRLLPLAALAAWCGASICVVDAAGRLVGLREPRARLPALRAGRAVARRPDAGVGRRPGCSARRGRGLGAAREGAPVASRRLFHDRRRSLDRSPPRPCRPVEPARTARRLRPTAGPVDRRPATNHRVAARLRLARRAAPHVLARRAARSRCSWSPLWFIWGDERLDAFGALVAAGLPAGAVVATAFALPGITSDGESLHTRRHDGVVFGVVLVAGLLVTAVLARVVRLRGGRGFRRALLAVGALVVRRHGRRSGVEGRGRVAELHELDRGGERRRPHRIGWIELPLGLVAAGLARASSTTRSRGRAPAHSGSPTCSTAAARPTP